MPYRRLPGRLRRLDAERLTGFREPDAGRQANFQGAIYATLDYTEQNDSTSKGPIIARPTPLANSTVNRYVPIGTLMPGMPASYEDVVALTNEPGSWG